MTGVVNDMANVMKGSPAQAPTASAPAGGPAQNLNDISSHLTLASMSADMFGGIARGYGAMTQANTMAEADANHAQDYGLQAKQEILAGQQTSNQIMDNMLQTISAQRLAYSANGMDLSFGTPVALEASTRKLAGMQNSVAGANSALTALSRRRQAASYMEQRANVLSSGYMANAADTFGGMINAGRTDANAIARSNARG